MNDDKFTEKLHACQAAAQLTVADIAWFFGRSHKTVRYWFAGTVPDPTNREYAHAKVQELWKAIRAGYLKPIHELNKRARAEYMRLLGEGQLGTARLLAADPARQRVVRRVRPAPRKSAAAGRRDDRRTLGRPRTLER